MKKIVIFLFIIFGLMVNTFSFADNNIHKKIDSIYQNNPEKLLLINNKIKVLINKTHNKNSKKTLDELNNYINYKFKNEDFYDSSLSDNIKTSIDEVNNKFTDQENLDSLNDFLNNKDLTFIDKEYLEFYILDNKISILLNHQNFNEAKKIATNYFYINNKFNFDKLDFLAKNIDYSSFGILTQLVSWTNPSKKEDIINYRIKYFPNEENTAYNVVRKLGYKGLDCDKLEIIDENRDLIDKKFCYLLNGKFSFDDDIKVIDELNNNLQNLSDRVNYYSYVGMYYPQYKDEMMEKSKDISEIIIKKDKNFINGYITLLNYFDYKNDCDNFDKYYKLMGENYIGDNDRKETLFNYKYINCSIKQ